jgi:hypothetical protein
MAIQVLVLIPLLILLIVVPIILALSGKATSSEPRTVACGRGARDGLGRRTRRFLRALLVAAIATPTIVPLPGLHGAIPMPASFALGIGVASWSGTAIVRGAIPLAVVFGIIGVVFVLQGEAEDTSAV